MKTLRFVCSLLLALALSLGSAALAEEPAVYHLGDTVQDFTVTTHDGKTVTLSQVLEEKDLVLINFWAVYCGPCRREFPAMEEAYEQYKDRVEIIALSVNTRDTDEILANYTAELGMTFPVGRDDASLWDKFGVIYQPTTLIVDRYGVLCFREEIARPDVSFFTGLFDTYLAEDYPASKLLAAYDIFYYDQDDQPVPGVMCQICDDKSCQFAQSDADGMCSFILPPYPWEIHTLKIPAGYSGDTETVTVAAREGDVLEFILTKE